ncbi:UNVERIFIED_CONTAM: hypothetical protein GTU68_002908, partial [Idotea baltica]|nr:hypothetical protein [Idotea baltica]
PGPSLPFASQQERNESPSLVERQSIGGSSSPVPSLSSLSSSGGTGDVDSPSDAGVSLHSPSSSSSLSRMPQAQEEVTT